MNEEQYNMTFGEWCNATKGTNLSLNDYGEIDWRDPQKSQVTEQYHDLWKAERKEYTLRDKNRKITNALESLKKHGIESVLCNYQNGHIKAKTKHGVILSYYATTGTIAGYRDTAVEGLDAFIELCNR